MRVGQTGVSHIVRDRIDIPGRTAKSSGAVVTVVHRITAVRAEAGVSADDSGGFIGAGKGSADQAGYALGIRLEFGGIDKGPAAHRISNSMPLAGTVIGEPDIRGGVGVINPGQFAGIRIVAVGGDQGSGVASPNSGMQPAAFEIGVLRTLILRIFFALQQARSLVVMPLVMSASPSLADGQVGESQPSPLRQLCMASILP